MSIRHGLLALLDRGPRYGSRLRTEFEARTGGTWPLNIGQVYTTLGRLERDGMVVQEGADEAGRALYALTEAGRAELRAWFAGPVERAGAPRDELAIKLVLAVGAPGVDVRRVVEAQRRHMADALHEYVRLRARALTGAPAEHPDELARLLVLEQLICHAEAEIRWLDHCETRLLRMVRGTRPEPPPP
ncbi:PadR family transcriptional regulator [Streptomyces pseudovenezuelae]|uniref:DNA-binding PadR family transcriptional regulator n=1 Tax=Streptomyces pseudovenezuelae TaxID=67350 RepID=A0ABT6LFA3_9ACTN|nr:PadR family transcriptional regulator [Streptomyces pseudovenezuelae]MDH6214989.1 DNA-binding PadR family transcriptional regulator [Streptomyces pseudovenezuelae]